MEISSPAFSYNRWIPTKYSCEGNNTSPPLRFEHIPPETASLVLLVEDPDAPAVKPWVHWVVFNIPPNIHGFEEGQAPIGAIEGINTSNTYGYEGPCPPDKAHRYIFRLYALNTILDLSEHSDRRAVLEAMQGHIITETELTGKYELEKTRKRKA